MELPSLRLEIGCSFGVDFSDGVNRKYSNSGTIGAFVDLPNGKVGCICCAHTVLHEKTLSMYKDSNLNILESHDPIEVYSPADRRDIPPFGQVTSIVYRNSTGYGDIGLDVALITITDIDRIPIDGNFKNNYGFNYKSGNILMEITKGLKLYIVGASSRLKTGWVIADDYVAVKSQYQVDQPNFVCSWDLNGEEDFHHPGDEGSLVMCDGIDGLNAIGIITSGRMITLGVTDKEYCSLITPIRDILNALRLPLRLKIFDEHMNIDPRFFNAYIDALKHGKEKTNTIRVNVVGNAWVGKSTLTKNLLGMIPDLNIDRTDGIDVHYYKSNKSTDWSSEDVPSDEKTAQRIAISSDAMQLNKPTLSSDLMQPKEKPIEQFDINTSHQSNPTEIKTPVDEIVQAVSLSESLPIKDEQRPLLTIPTDDVNINETDKESIRRFSSKLKKGHLTNETSIQIWDFGGQFVYYATHQLFHTQRAVYLLVLDASADLNDITETCELTNASRNKDVKYFCKFWMHSIHSFAGNDKNEPPVILVATKTDEKKGWNEEMQKAFFESVRQLFDGTPVGYHIQPKCFAVNNFSKDVCDFRNLRSYIEEVAKRQDSWNYTVPARWIPLEDSLSKRTAEKCITLDDIRTIGSELKVPILDELQIKAFLMYHHDLGNLVYFNDDDLSEFAVLKPQWIIDAFKTIITAKAEQYCMENGPLREKWKQLINEAILSKELIKAVWNIDNENQFSRNEAILLKYLIKLGIISEVTDIHLNKIKKEHKDYFIVPSLLNVKLSQLSMEQLTERNRTVTQTALVFAFEDNHVPKMLHHRLTAAALGKWNVLVLGEQRMLAENIGVYELDEVHAGLIEVCDTSIEIRVVNLCGENINPVQTDKLRRFVRLKIDAEFQRFSKTRTSPYTLRVCCYINNKKGKKTIDLNTIETTVYERVPCPDKHSGHFINKADIMNLWICSPKNNVNDKDGIIKQFARDFKRDLTLTVTEKEMAKVACALGFNWELLGIELGLSMVNIDQIKMDNPNTSEIQIFKMLKTWALKEAEKASIEKLLVAIDGAVRLKLNVDWDKIKNMLDECVP